MTDTPKPKWRLVKRDGTVIDPDLFLNCPVEVYEVTGEHIHLTDWHEHIWIVDPVKRKYHCAICDAERDV